MSEVRAMALATDYYAPLGLPADVRADMGAREEQEHWQATSDGRWLLRTATHLRADPLTVAGLLAGAAPSPVLTSYRDGEATAQDARTEARRLRDRMTGRMSGAQRRALYGRYAALCALLLSPREAAGYAHAACAYGRDVSAEIVRAEIPWTELEALAAANMPAPPEEPQVNGGPRG